MIVGNMAVAACRRARRWYFEEGGR